MKKVYLAILGVALFSATGFAQKGKNEIGVGADLSLPTGDLADAVKTGFGGYAKGMYGIGEAGQISLTVGYSGFKGKESTDDIKLTFKMLPVLAGYRHHFGNVFAEPQIGFGNYTSKIKVEGDDEFDLGGKDSEGAFTWAIGGGYIFNEKLEAGIRYQSASKDGTNFSFVGIHVGYNFSLGK
jgi:hypothetical protein